MRGEHGVNGLALLVGRQEDGVGDDGDVTVNVHAQVQFHDVTVLDDDIYKINLNIFFTKLFTN